MYSQFFVANLRGEPLLIRDYRGVLGKESVDVFYRSVISSKTAAAPCHSIDGIVFYYVRQHGLFLVLTALDGPAAPAPSFTIELLCRTAAVLKDFCGVLSEEAIRRNVVLAYEVLDDLIDWGYAQSTSTELLRPLVHTVPVAQFPVAPSSQQSPEAAAPGLEAKSQAPITAGAAVELVERKVGEVLERLGGNGPAVVTASQSVRTVKSDGGADAGGGGKKREEVFVDLTERLSAVFGPTGEAVTCSVTGSLVIRNYVTGQPDVVVALSDDIAMEDFNFHGCVRADTFSVDRTLRAAPPAGETVVMSYRASAARVDVLPFRVYPFVEEQTPTKIATTVKIYVDLPPERHAVNVSVRVPVPRTAATVFCESTAGAVEYRREESAVVCSLSRVQGGVEFAFRASISLEKPSAGARKEVGPVDLSFEIPAWTATRLMIRNVAVEDRCRPVKCFRWTRALTLSNSYVRRIV